MNLNTRYVIKHAAEDLEIIGAILLHLGTTLEPGVELPADWVVWFGRQIEIISEGLEKVAEEDG